MADLYSIPPDLSRLYSLSCVLRSCFGHTKCYLPFIVSRDLSLVIKAKSLPKGLKDILKDIPALGRQLGVEINQTCDCYKQRKDVLNKQGSVFFEFGIRCPAPPALKKAAGHIFSASPAKFGIVSHVEHSIRKISDMTMVKETDIEKHIAPLVVALNGVEDFCTVYSCQGHRFCLPVMSPFVSFLSKNTATVMEFARRLYQRQLHYKWRLSGMVINYCPVYLPYVMWRLDMGNVFFTRRKVRHDIERIKELLADLQGQGDYARQA